MAPLVAVSLSALFAAVFAALQGDAATCAHGQCPTEDDVSMMALPLRQDRLQLAQSMGVRSQRNDDFVPVVAPGPSPVQPFEEHLPIPEPLPAPNPAQSPFIANYVPENCMSATWPFFSDVSGTWHGSNGQNFISLPQFDARPMGKQFLVQVNNYSENLTFEAIGGPVLNRGYMYGVQVNPMNQSDQVLSGLLYTQSVMDNDLQMGIHEENGQILHKACVEANGHITDPWNILRQGAIPHGSQPMGYGNLTVVETPDDDFYVQTLLRIRASYEFSVQPFVPGCGSKYEQQRTQSMGTATNTVMVNNTGPLASTDCCIGTSNYMRGTDQCPMTGCPEPIDTLIQAVKDLKVVKYVQLNMSTTNSIPPIVPMGRWVPDIQGGGVQNTGFVNYNAQAESRSFRNLVFLLNVQNSDGSEYQMLQYIQTVDLKFLAAAPACPDQVWPHVDANTLTRVGSPPAPAPSTPAPTPAPWDGPPCRVGDRVQCPGSPGTYCQGNQCCPGVNGGPTTPCPSASPGFGGCKAPTGASCVESR